MLLRFLRALYDRVRDRFGARVAQIGSAATVLALVAVAVLAFRGGGNGGNGSVLPDPTASGGATSSPAPPPDDLAFRPVPGGPEFTVPGIPGLRLVAQPFGGGTTVFYLAVPGNPYGIAPGAVAGYFNPNLTAVDLDRGSVRRIGAVGLDYRVFDVRRAAGDIAFAIPVDPTAPSGSPNVPMEVQVARKGMHVGVPVGSAILNPYSKNLAGGDAAIALRVQTSRVTALDFERVRAGADGAVFNFLLPVASTQQGIDGPAKVPGGVLGRIEQAAFDSAFVVQMKESRFQFGKNKVNASLIFSNADAVETPRLADIRIRGWDDDAPVVHLLAPDSSILG